MKLIIHDLEKEGLSSNMLPSTEDVKIITEDSIIHNCIGCFGCWLKTPGKCVLKDNYDNMGELLSKCHELIIISRCIYGSYSPFIRNILDRSISFLLPYFAEINGETHHKNRYNNQFTLTAHFYGDDITKAERETAKALVTANGINFYSSGNKAYFHDRLQSIKERLQ